MTVTHKYFYIYIFYKYICNTRYYNVYQSDLHYKITSKVLQFIK